MEKAKHKKRHTGRVILILAILILLLVGAGFFVHSQYTLVNWKPVPVRSVTLDLSGQGLTHIDDLSRCENLAVLDVRGNPLPAGELRQLRATLPGCEILCDVPLGGQLYDSGLTSLTLEDLPSDWSNMTFFNHLALLTVERCSDPRTMDELRKTLPDCRMTWQLALGGEWYDTSAEELTLSSGTADADELLERLGWFSSLRDLTLPDSALPVEEQLSLTAAYPEVAFHWDVIIGDRRLPNDLRALTLGPGEYLDLALLDEALPLLPELRKLELTGSDISGPDRAAFLNAHPDMDVSWTVELFGETYPWDTETIDLSEMPLEDTAEIEEAVACLPRLKTVDMCDTGLDNETMDALNQKYPDTRFVWMVRFSGYKLRTDVTYFVPSSFGDPPPAILNQHLDTLKYCRELRALDLGHMYFTDLSFLAYMPHMTYLILAESAVTDLTPLAGLKELKYIEAFKTAITDLSPLLQCPALEDLNICYTWVGADNAMEVLPQLKQLQRLWWCNTSLNWDQQAELQEQLPDCIFFFLHGGESSGGIWRYHENYYEMRDAFHMYYMPGGTNGVDDDGAQIIIDDHGREYHLQGYDYKYQRWWEDPRYAAYHPFIIGITDQ